MKNAFASILCITVLLTLAACGGTVDNNVSQKEPSESSVISSTEITPDLGEVPDDDFSDASVQNENGEDNMANISITVNGSVFLAKLYDNDASGALLTHFPLTLDMSDLNGNEKYYYLDGHLPFESTEKPANINAGDIMCWSGNCLVLFYKTFSNSYGGYVRLGYVENASGFAAALGNGGVEVAFAAGDCGKAIDDRRVSQR